MKTTTTTTTSQTATFLRDINDVMNERPKAKTLQDLMAQNKTASIETQFMTLNKYIARSNIEPIQKAAILHTIIKACDHIAEIEKEKQSLMGVVNLFCELETLR